MINYQSVIHNGIFHCQFILIFICELYTELIVFQTRFNFFFERGVGEGEGFGFHLHLQSLYKILDDDWLVRG